MRKKLQSKRQKPKKSRVHITKTKQDRRMYALHILSMLIFSNRVYLKTMKQRAQKVCILKARIPV